MAKPKTPETPLAKRLVQIIDFINESGLDVTSLGVGKTALSEYQRGTKVPRSDFLVNLHSLCGVNLHWVLTGEGLMFEETPPKLPDGAPVNVAMQSKYIKPVLQHLARVQKQKQIHLEPDLVWWIISSIHNALLEEHHGANVDSDEFNELLTELIDKQLEKGGW